MTRGPQPMPVADAICSPGRVILYPPYDKNDPMLSTKNLQNCPQWAWSTKFHDDMLVKCKRVNFGAAPSQNDVMPVKGIDIPDAVKLAELLCDAVGPQRLPFDHLWFEGTWPNAEQWLSPHTEALAVRAKTGEAIYRDTGQPVPPNTSSSLDLFCLLKNGCIVRQPVLLQLYIDHAGMPMGVGANGYAANYLCNAEVDDQDIIWWTVGMTLPAMWAIGLMNCKNVKTQERQRVPVKTKKMRRARDTGALSYSTIVLPRHSGGGEGGGGATGMTRLHTVCGHFATYTGEAPLFGKYTGTYWRPWHLAGNPDRGVVESDYKLEVAE